MKRASLLLTLGTLQVGGATFSLCMLVMTGASKHMIAGVVLTVVVSVISLVLKNFVWKKEPKHH